jgi:hypothetical protein
MKREEKNWEGDDNTKQIEASFTPSQAVPPSSTFRSRKASVTESKAVSSEGKPSTSTSEAQKISIQLPLINE